MALNLYQVLTKVVDNRTGIIVKVDTMEVRSHSEVSAGNYAIAKTNEEADKNWLDWAAKHYGIARTTLDQMVADANLSVPHYCTVKADAKNVDVDFKRMAIDFYKHLGVDERINLKGNYERATAMEYDNYDDSLFFPLESADGIDYLYECYTFFGEEAILWKELCTNKTMEYSA